LSTLLYQLDLEQNTQVFTSTGTSYSFQLGSLSTAEPTDPTRVPL